MSIHAVELQNSQNSLCVEHETNHTSICLSDGCQNRWLCHRCQLSHSKGHIQSIFSLDDIKTGEFLNKINQTFSQKQETLQEKLNNKENLIASINKAFIDAQNEIETVLIEAKTQIILQIEKIYQGLSQDYDERYFSQINEYLVSLGQKMRIEDRFRAATDIENFSGIYSKVLFALNDGIETTTKLEENNIDFRQMLEDVKGTCNKLVAALFKEVPAELPQKGFSKEQTKLTPQEITCVTHCPEYGLFVAGGHHGLLTLWNDKTFDCVSQVQVYDGSITLATYLSSTKTIVTTTKDSIGLTRISPDGSLSHWNKIKVHKTLQHIVTIDDDGQIATISQFGAKVRLWKSTEQALDFVGGIDVPAATNSTKLFYLKRLKQIGVVYDDNIKIFSLSNGTLVADLYPQQFFMQKSSLNDLSAQFRIISTCFVETTQTVHTIVSQTNMKTIKYFDVVWEKTAEDDYVLVDSIEIEDVNACGQPLELIPSSDIILAVFKNAFKLYKAHNSTRNSCPSQVLLTHNSSGQNQQPSLLLHDGTKVIITDGKNSKKLKIFA